MSKTPNGNTPIVGFANLPNQAHRRMVKRGFEFTLMLVGESGLGKSTLVSALFHVNKDYNGNDLPSTLTTDEKLTQTVKITKNEVQIEDKGVKLKLAIVDTPGFGESLTGVDQQEPISRYIDEQFQQYLDDETGINRRNIADSRVHCCFYFISPHSNGLRPMDINFMKQLHHKVNIVPLIAKSDTLTPEEIKFKKARIRDDITREQIRLYQLPDSDEDDDQSYKTQLQAFKQAIPFAVVGSTDTYEANGRKVRGRLYPWGVVEIENPKHSEFTLLRTMLITHMQDLQEVTHDLHYENYRAQVLKNGPSLMMNSSQNSNVHHQSMSSMGGSNEAGSGESEQNSLEAKEMEIKRMREMMAQMQRELAIQQHQQQQQQMQSSMVMNSMEQMPNGHINGHVNASPGGKHRPPPPPRRVEGSGSYGRSNLDV